MSEHGFCKVVTSDQDIEDFLYACLSTDFIRLLHSKSWTSSTRWTCQSTDFVRLLHPKEWLVYGVVACMNMDFVGALHPVRTWNSRVVATLTLKNATKSLIGRNNQDKHNMANTVLIIGNGFDVDLGLKSKYTDFIEADEWKKMCEIIQGKFPEKFQQISLLLHMIRASKAPQLWFDVEFEIYKFIKDYPVKEIRISSSHRGLTEEEYIMLRNTLASYLKRITNEFSLNTNKWAYILLKTLQEYDGKAKIFTFNYTDSCKICKLPQLDVTYIHGKLEDNDIILGCEKLEAEYFPKSFNFFRKSSMIRRPNNIIQELLEANEVIFFGHSLNVFDYSYFEEFFANICFPIDHQLYLTFVTRNRESELDIRDNLREQGIQVQNLYKSNIKTTFIHSEPQKQEKSNEQDKWNTLIQRIKCK